MSGIGDLGEFGLIGRLANLLPSGGGVVEGIGDDCAVVRVGSQTLLLTSDAMVEDVHFRRAYMAPEDIGWKAAAAAMSDIGAMGGTPRFLLVTLAVPAGESTAFIEDLYGGLAAAASAFDAVVVGGDTTRANGGMTLDVMVVGEPGLRTVLRSDAQPGDLLAVTGWPGRSAAGLHALHAGSDAPALALAHRRPQPRIAEGRWLAEQAGVHAMIDLSDGLAQDAGHLADRSGLAVDLTSAMLPVHEALRTYAAAHEMSAARCILSGGEDYELAVALDPDEADEIAREFEVHYGLPLTKVGRFSSGVGVRVDGSTPDRGGYDHFLSA